MISAVSRSAMLAQVRSLLHEHSLAAWVVVSSDEHQSEYVSPFDMRREAISGFSGSAGTAVITPNEALLWTDGRYWNQAEKQLDLDEWKVMRSGHPSVPSIESWLASSLPSGSLIGIDPLLSNVVQLRTMESNNLNINTNVSNLIDQTWVSRPAASSNPIYSVSSQFSGRTTRQKLHDLSLHLHTISCTCCIMNSLDDIAWLYNLRGTDIDYNPLFKSYSFVDVVDELPVAILYLSCDQLLESARNQLAVDGVLVRPYETFLNDMALHQFTGQLSLDPLQCSVAMYQSVQHCQQIKESDSPVQILKSIKNRTELDGFRSCHVRDGVALCRFLAWVNNRVRSGLQVDEMSAADKLEEFRSEGEYFKGLSFPTISGSGPNSAIIHYAPSAETNRELSSSEMYLCDSGAQYFDGTTDVTRTIHFGVPTRQEVDSFTRVLIGNIQLTMMKFPHGHTTGHQLDVLARTALWDAQLDYQHGTGHGVGSFLCVHEGPQGFAALPRRTPVPLHPEQTITIEPGYYLPGHFGIRIENCVIIRECDNNSDWLQFETVTLAPIQRDLVDLSMMSARQIQWVNEYHQQVWTTIGPLLNDIDSFAHAWLKKECQPWV